MGRVARCWTVVAVLLVAACDDDAALPGAGDGGAAGATASDAGPVGRGTGGTGGGGSVDCAAVAKAYCGAIDRCASFWVRIGFGDVATCEARLAIGCVDQKTAPGTGYSAPAINSCVSAVSAAACPTLLDNAVTGCSIAGTRANGEACGGDAQCSSSHCKQDGICGRCAARPAAGDDCVENEDCQVGLVCFGPDGKKRCAAPAMPGAACSDTAPCTFGNFCKQGACAKVAGPGEPCSGEGSCDGAQALYCDDGAKTCRKAALVGPGETCGLVNETFTVCTGGGTCVGFNPKALRYTGVCAAAAKDGEACGAGANGRQCLAPARCDAGVCKLPASMTCQ